MRVFESKDGVMRVYALWEVDDRVARCGASKKAQDKKRRNYGT